jgi:hypothetical protein
LGTTEGTEVKFSLSFAIALIIVAGTGTFRTADAGIAYVGQITVTNTEEISLFILPDGSGQGFTQAMAFGGQITDASITLLMTEFNGTPVPYFPGQDIWLDAESTTDSHCPDYAQFSPDGNTDINGQTSFTASLTGSGWSEGPVWVYHEGARSAHPTAGEHPPVQLRFNSADIDGDGNINLTDVAAFSTDFFGSYHYRSDFHWDGQLNLADVAKMASGFGHDCQ